MQVIDIYEFSLLQWLHTHTHTHTPVHGKDLKTSNIQDADEGGSLALGAVQGAVDTHHNPLEEPLVQSLANGLYSKLTLPGRKSMHVVYLHDGYAS